MKKILFLIGFTTILTLTACQTPPKYEPETNPQKQEKTEEIKPETIPEITKSTAEADFTKLKVIDPLVILKEKVDEKVKSPDQKGISEKEYKNTIGWTFFFYETGKLKIDPYKDWSLLVLSKACDGPCPAVIYRFAWDLKTNKVINLENHSYQPTEEDYKYMDEEMKFLLKEKDSKTVIKSLELPETIKIPETGEVLELAEKDVYLKENQDYETKKLIKFGLGKVIFTDPALGDIYLEEEEKISCLYAILPDGTIQRYGFNPKFFDEKDTKGNTATLADNSKKLDLENDFHYFETGCGVTAGCHYILENVNENNLKLVATTGNDIELYGIKETLLNAFNENKDNTATDEQRIINEVFAIRGAFESKDDYNSENLQKFADENKVLFWKDPFGRYSYITHNDIASAAECGKPVIYLYPKKTMDVKVAVGIDNITVSIPEHGKNGWTVKARPNGELYNYEDGQTYPYLFWEGTDKEQIKVSEGFTVARENITNFLNDSLSKLGLNETEKRDFMEFWESRILENPQPYFYFSFLGTRDFNKIAPLEISPKPDTLIRVFMYYHPLNKNIKVRPQTLRSIARKGFTVIEWGGTSNTDFLK